MNEKSLFNRDDLELKKFCITENKNHKSCCFLFLKNQYKKKVTSGSKLFQIYYTIKQSNINLK